MIKAEPGYGEAPLDEDDAKGLDDRIRQLTLPDGRARFGWSVRMRDDWGTVHAVMAPPAGMTPEALAASLGDPSGIAPELAARGVVAHNYDWSWSLDGALLWVADGVVHVVYDEGIPPQLEEYVNAHLDAHP